jgi:hypothetical protein
MSMVICWHDDRTDVRHSCPARDGDHILWGRCRSGARWFWTAVVFGDGREEYGWGTTEDEAIVAARAAVVRLTGGGSATAHQYHGQARHRLKAYNDERRQNRPPSEDTAAASVEYLYGSWTGENADGHIVAEVEKFRIIKTTKKRIFYDRGRGRTGSVDRATLEGTGEVYNRSAGWREGDYHLFADRANAEQTKPVLVDCKADVSRLRAEMANAHPDRGGTDAEFIAARQRYVRAVSRDAS